MKLPAMQSHSTASASRNLNNTLGHYSSSSESEEEEVEYEPLPGQDQDEDSVAVSSEDARLSASKMSSTADKAQLDAQKKQPRKKKGKVFASKDSMLALIEKVNLDQDEKIKGKVDRDLEYMKRQAAVNEASKNRKAKKEQRLSKIKDNLRKGGIRLKGENKRSLKSLRQEKTNGASKKAFQRPEKKDDKKAGKRVKFAD